MRSLSILSVVAFMAGSLFSASVRADEGFFYVPLYLSKLDSAKVKEEPVLINGIDVGLTKTMLEVTGVFRDFEGYSSASTPADFLIGTDRITRVVHILSRQKRGEFDNTVSRPEKSKTIVFEVQGFIKKIVYLPAFPEGKDLDEVLSKVANGELSIDKPFPAEYFRFEFDPDEPTKDPVEVTRIKQ